MKKLEKTKLKIIKKNGREGLAYVYVAETENNNIVEFVESVTPPLSREEKWVLIASTLCGCPVGCKMCDAGSFYKGKLEKNEILSQVDYMITRRYPSCNVPVKKLKIQFARMGEPSFNENVLNVLEELPKIYKAPGLMPCISTIAPRNNEFFRKLLEIKNKYYKELFQLQFSIHTTDQKKRDDLIPVNKWNLGEIADYGRKFHKGGERKITLNFAMAENYPVDIEKVYKYFDPEVFLIKLTPLNPTKNALKNKLKTVINSDYPKKSGEIVKKFEKIGFDTILSIGEIEENEIGSNCGLYAADIMVDKNNKA